MDREEGGVRGPEEGRPEGDAGKDGHQHPSWLEPLWDDSYLLGRDPIAINVNYFFGFKEDPSPRRNTQVSLPSLGVLPSVLPVPNPISQSLFAAGFLSSKAGVEGIGPMPWPHCC